MNSSIFLAIAAILAQVGIAQQIDTIAGNGQTGSTGDGAAALQATIASASAIAVDGSGNVYFNDTANARVRKISTSGIISTVAGNGSLGGSPKMVPTEGQPAISVALGPLRGLAVDATGTLYISDQWAIRKVDASGALFTVVGLGPVYADNVAGSKTALGAGWALAFDTAGNLYFTDIGVIRKLDTAGIVTTVAGKFGTSSSTGDEGAAKSATLNNPQALAVDGAGNVYVFELIGQRVRKITPDGIIHALIGANGPGYAGDNGPAANAKFAQAAGMATDTAGNLYFADTQNQRIRCISPEGIISTIAGSGTQGFSGDGGPANVAKLAGPEGLAADASGNIYIGDTFNRRIRRVSRAASTPQPRIAANGIVNAASFSKRTTPGALITIFGTDLASAAASADRLPLTTTLAGVSVSIGGVPAPLIYVSPTQINAQLPYESAAIDKLPVVVTSNGVNSAVAEVYALGDAPGIFTYGDNRAVAQNEDSSLNDQAHPARSGSVITTYMTGGGPATNRPATGAASPSNPLARFISVPSVTIGGKKADVLFAGLAPGFVGLAQVNLRVPVLTPGDYPLVITIGTTPSNVAMVAIR